MLKKESIPVSLGFALIVVLLVAFFISFGLFVPRGETATEEIIVGTEADTYVQSGDDADTNNGGSYLLRIHKTEDSSDSKEGYLKFRIPEDSRNLTRAIVTLYVSRSDSSGQVVNEVLAALDDTWQEDLLVWNNKPALSNEVITSFVPVGGQYLHIDVTSLAQQANTADKVFSLAIRSPSFVDVRSRETMYSSREHRASERPKLTLTFTDPEPTPTFTPVPPTDTPPPDDGGDNPPDDNGSGDDGSGGSGGSSTDPAILDPEWGDTFYIAPGQLFSRYMAIQSPSGTTYFCSRTSTNHSGNYPSAPVGLTINDSCQVIWTPDNSNVGTTYEVNARADFNLTNGSATHYVRFYVEVTNNPPEQDNYPVLGSIIGGSDPVFVGDTLTRSFTATNVGNTTVTLDELVLGGRLNGVDDCSNYINGACPDFTKRYNIALAPGASYTYTGTLTPQLPGDYEFQVFYCVNGCDSPDDWHWNISTPEVVEVYPSFKLPLPGGKHWLLTTEIGDNGCTRVGTDPAPSHAGINFHSLDFDNISQEAEVEVDVPILAAAGGKVIQRGTDPNHPNGYYLVIDHDYDGNVATGYTTRYLHLKNAANPQVGDSVSQGDQIGIMGGSGGWPVHLHIGFRYNNDGSASNSALQIIKMEGLPLAEYREECAEGTKTPIKYYPSTNN